MSTDTPETDAQRSNQTLPQAMGYVHADFARKLEREKNAMQAEARKYITLWDRATKDLETLKFGPETP